MTANENTVYLGELDKQDAKDHLDAELSSVFVGVEDAVPKFTQVDNYTTFRAEYTFLGEDIVAHFFVTSENNSSDYWLKTFPALLDACAREYFQADHPRLVAKYTDEVKSWWFKAHGYAHSLAPDKLMLGFFEALDHDLEGK